MLAASIRLVSSFVQKRVKERTLRLVVSILRPILSALALTDVNIELTRILFSFRTEDFMVQPPACFRSLFQRSSLVRGYLTYLVTSADLKLATGLRTTTSLASITKSV